MLKNHHLAQHIQDHAWGKLIQFTRSKAEKAGKVVELVNARYTSQKCSQCGIMVPRHWKIEPISVLTAVCRCLDCIEAAIDVVVAWIGMSTPA